MFSIVRSFIGVVKGLSIDAVILLLVLRDNG